MELMQFAAKIAKTIKKDTNCYFFSEPQVQNSNSRFLSDYFPKESEYIRKSEYSDFSVQ
jgi:hypothetical protein